jgi:hypothetical protein
MLGYYFGIMKAAMFPALALLVNAIALRGAVNQSCKTGSDDPSLLHIHGRLSVYNGGYPNLRLWQIGTNHLFGIYSDPADLKCSRGEPCSGGKETKLPDNLQGVNLLESSVYGDFAIRTLEPFQSGHMQAACIVDAHRIVRGRSK